MQDEDPVPLVQRSMLAHLEAQQCADAADVRILHFKGPFAVTDFPARAGTHTDADILVAPGGVPILVEALLARGWTLYHQNEEGLAGHGQVLVHPQRSCSIDLHHYFPGLRSRWPDNFDAMYAQKIIWPVDSYPALTTLNRIDHALVLLLDTLADRIGPESIRTYRNRAIWQGLSDEETEALRQRARTLNVLELVDPEQNQAETHRDRRRLLMQMQHEPGVQGAAVWLQRLEDSETLGRKARVLWLALTAVPASDDVGSYPVRLIRHWGRGALQILKILKRSRIPRQHEDTDTMTSNCTVAASPSSGEGAEAQSEAVVDDQPSEQPAITSPGANAGQGAVADSVVWFVDSDASGAAIELHRGKTLSLSGPAALLWLALADTVDVDGAIEMTLAQYSDPPAEAANQLRSIVTQLQDIGML